MPMPDRVRDIVTALVRNPDSLRTLQEDPRHFLTELGLTTHEQMALGVLQALAGTVQQRAAAARWPETAGGPAAGATAWNAGDSVAIAALAAIAACVGLATAVGTVAITAVSSATE